MSDETPPDEWRAFADHLDSLSPGDHRVSDDAETPSPALASATPRRRVRLTRGRLEKLRVRWHRFPSNTWRIALKMAGMLAATVACTLLFAHYVEDQPTIFTFSLLMACFAGTALTVMYLVRLVGNHDMRRAEDADSRLHQENYDIVEAINDWTLEYRSISEEVSHAHPDSPLAALHAARRAELIKGIGFHLSLLRPAHRPREAVRLLEDAQQERGRETRNGRSPIYDEE